MNENKNPIFDYVKLTEPVPDSPNIIVEQFSSDDIQITIPPGKYNPDFLKAAVEEGPGPWDDVLRKEGFDPEFYEVIEPIQWSSWDGAGEGRKMSVKLQLRSKRPVEDIDLEAIYKEIRKKKPAKVPKIVGDDALLVCIADSQMGKSDGEGVTGTITRLTNLEWQVRERILELRKAGKPIKKLVVAFMGDLIENCDGHYPMQTFTAELNLRNQNKVMRRIGINLLDSWVDLAEEILVLAVPGNHGENRKNGKAYTDFGDNFDVAIVEEIHDAFKTNPERYGHIKFVLPDTDLTVTLKIAGQGVLFAHGHQFRGSGPISQRAWTWWQKQAFSFRPALLANILISGHYHHWSSQSRTEGRWWFQCPALEDKSQWFEEEQGENAQAGVLTMRITEKGPEDIQIIV